MSVRERAALLLLEAIGPAGGEIIKTDATAKAMFDATLPLVERMLRALEPFAQCVDQVAADESDDEWAKFRLLVGNYRDAANATRPLDQPRVEDAARWSHLQHEPSWAERAALGGSVSSIGDA